MKIIAESTWSWMLYADGERRWLSVICGTVGLYEIVIELDAAERERVTDDLTQVERLARAIAGAPSRYRTRHCPHLLDTPAAHAATADWRAGRSNHD